MSAAFEFKIKSQLTESMDLVAQADHLMDMVRAQELHDSELSELASFFYICKLFPSVIELCAYQVETKRPVSWHLLANVLSAEGLLEDPELVRALYFGAKDEDALDVLARSEALDPMYPELAELRERRRAKKYVEHHERRKMLMDQIEIARAQQMLVEEKRLIDYISRVYPNEQLGPEQRQLFQERWARDVIGRSRRAKTVKVESTDSGVSPEHHTILDLLLAQALEHQQKDARLAQEFPTMFLMFEAYDHALQVLQAGASSPAGDWLHAEVLLKLRRFVEAISLIQELEIRYADNPETVFSAAYLKAQALWGLSRRALAIEIMESLVSSRPTYRSAHSYLSLWKRSER